MELSPIVSIWEAQLTLWRWDQCFESRVFLRGGGAFGSVSKVVWHICNTYQCIVCSARAASVDKILDINAGKFSIYNPLTPTHPSSNRWGRSIPNIQNCCPMSPLIHLIMFAQSFTTLHNANSVFVEITNSPNVSPTIGVDDRTRWLAPAFTDLCVTLTVKA